VPAALHVVTVIGYEDHADRVRLRNSWGEGWGNLGYARVACRFISDYVLEAWTIDRLLY
jgi:C1A family cysteine protease